MTYFQNGDINILFIHIPKTGGSSVEHYFSNKFNIPLNNKSLFTYEYDKTNEYNNKYKFLNSSLQHLLLNQIFKYNNVFNINFNDIQIITIVRNPYERIISDLFWYKIIKMDTSKEEVFNIIQEYLVSDNYDNHNIPQHEFITINKNLISNIRILRTETLTNDMKKIGYHDFDFFYNVSECKVNYYNYLNNDSIIPLDIYTFSHLMRPFYYIILYYIIYNI